MKYLITGYSGQLGYDIARELSKDENNIIITPNSKEMDITNKEKVTELILNEKPDVVFHCAAWTQVDKAEDMEEIVYKVNVEGTENITLACKEIGAKLFYFSTDYVFDGTKEGLYTENDKPNPKNVYGKTKYLGEKIVEKYDKSYIIRISWVFGINGNNFIKTMLKLANLKDELSVVCDQVGTPTYTEDLATAVIAMSKTDKYGLYHINNDEFCSWAEFAEYIFKVSNNNTKVNYVTTEEYLELTGTKQAYRPRNSKLSKEKFVNAGFEMLPSWKEATKRYIKELKKI